MAQQDETRSSVEGFGRVSTVQALVRSLRELVLDGRVPAGAPLREKELVLTYGVSRHSMRQALQALVSDGLLRHEPHRGVFVPELSADDIRDLYRLRMVLEEEAVRTFAARGEAPEGARRALEELKKLSVDSPWQSVMAADVDFHTELVSALESPRITRLYRSLNGELQLCLRQAHEIFVEYADIGRDHGALLDAIDTGNVEEAVRSLRSHLEGSLANVLKQAQGPSAT